ncbi:MAG TPA: hypothetical protein VE593_08605 [Nitrososphaeraceae archaeon]|nr:hypothetical protein [Nitrososphaeraceae archaeon]
MAESIMGEKCANEVVKYSMIIDSRDIVIAYTKTTHDLRINNAKKLTE